MKQLRIIFLLVLVLSLAVAGCRNADDADEEAGGASGEAAGSDSAPGEGSQAVATESLQTPPPPMPILVRTETIDPPAASRVTAGTAVQHQVVQGEWLLLIARCYGADYNAVRQANSLANVNAISPGTMLTIPNPGSQGPIVGPPCIQKYVVQSGDTWPAIAQRFQTTTAVLQQINPGGLFAGRQMLVPASAPQVAPLPLLTHDLIFNFGGDVATWWGDNGRLQVSTHSAYVLDVAVSDSGNWVLLKQTRDSGATVEIALLDRRTQRMTIIERGLTPDLAGTGSENMLISADDRYGVYLVREETGPRAVVLETASPGTRRTAQIVGHGNDDTVLPQLFPGDDNDTFLWLDEAGVFRFDYALQIGERRLYQIDATVPDGPLRLTAVAWSPTGRYLLLQGSLPEGAAHFVLDTETGGLQRLPGSDVSVTAAAVSWLLDGTAVVFSPPTAPNAGPQVTTYRPAADGSGLLQLAQTTLAQPLRSDAESGGSGYAITAPPLQKRAGQLIMSIQAADTAVDGIWAIPDGEAAPTRLTAIPADAYNLHWTPDGTGLLMEVPGQPGIPGDVAFLPADGGQAFSLARWLGLQISDFHWVLP